MPGLLVYHDGRDEKRQIKIISRVKKKKKFGVFFFRNRKEMGKGIFILFNCLKFLGGGVL